jgi:hypothetical protein
MPLLSITKQYGKAVFVDHTRTMNSVPASYQPDVKKYAAGVLVTTVNGVPTPQPSGYYVETIDEAEEVYGTITLDQHAEILNLNPDMAHRPPTSLMAEPTIA